MHVLPTCVCVYVSVEDEILNSRGGNLSRKDISKYAAEHR